MTKEEWFKRFKDRLNEIVGDDFNYEEVAQASYDVMQEEGDDDMTPEEWAEAEYDAWVDSQ